MLPRTKRLILGLVQKFPGIDGNRLRELVWAHDPAGGPEDRKVVYVHVNQLNKLLAPFGVMVRGSVSGGYRLLQRR